MKIIQIEIPNDLDEQDFHDLVDTLEATLNRFTRNTKRFKLRVGTLFSSLS